MNKYVSKGIVFVIIFFVIEIILFLLKIDGSCPTNPCRPGGAPRLAFFLQPLTLIASAMISFILMEFVFLVKGKLSK